MCRKSTTQDPWLYFPSKGSQIQDFSSLKKIHRSRSGLNLRTSDPVASMITTRPLGSTFLLCILDLESRSKFKFNWSISSNDINFPINLICKFQNVSCALGLEVIIISVLPKGRFFTASSGTKAAVLPKGRSSTANSGT